MLKRGPDACPVGRVPAAEIEAAVVGQLRAILRQPEIIVGTWRAARAEQDDMTEDEAGEALLQLEPLCDELSRRSGRGSCSCWSGGPAEGGGVKRATISADGETITVHIPMTFRKRGGRKFVVTPDGAPWAPRPRVDNAMVKALALAFRWRKQLD